MEKLLRPEKFEGCEGTSSEQWRHWHRTFTNFLDSIKEVSDPAKLQLLINYVSPSVYSYISECSNYVDAVKVLESVFAKPPNEIFARHRLAIRKQQGSETIDQFLHSLKRLAKDCAFRDVTADIYTKEAVRDAFITGLSSSLIRQRLLEKQTLSLEEAVLQARSMETAQHNAEIYVSTPSGFTPAVASVDAALPAAPLESLEDAEPSAAASSKAPCGMGDSGVSD